MEDLAQPPKTTLPPPPIPPAELDAAAPPPSIEPAVGISPEMIKSAAEDYATGTAMLFDLPLTRRGWTPTSPDELKRMAAQWEKVITKYPALATPTKYPELGLVGLAVGMVFVRVVAEREHLAKEAEEARRAEGNKGTGS